MAILQAGTTPEAATNCHHHTEKRLQWTIFTKPYTYIYSQTTKGRGGWWEQEYAMIRSNSTQKQQKRLVINLQAMDPQ